MERKRLSKRLFSVLMAFIMVISVTTVTGPAGAKAATEDWALVPSDHTPAGGMELMTNVTNLVSAYGDFSNTVSIATTTGTVTQEDGMLVLADGSNAQIPIGNVTSGTTYVASYYVWTVGDTVLYDMDFDGAGSPNTHEAGYGYSDNVLANWQTTASTSYQYGGIVSCTLDGESTTSSITSATNGWKKIEVVWTPDNTGAAYLNLGGFSTTHGAVTGTVYIDDLAVYAKPVELETTLNFYKDIAGQFAFNNFNSELTSYTGTYTGPVIINGVETTSTFYLTASLFHTGVLAALNNKEVKSIAIATGARFVRNDGAAVVTVTQGITCTPPASYTTDSYDTDTERKNWTSVYDSTAEKEEIILNATYYGIPNSSQIQYNVKSTGGDFVVDDFHLGKTKRGWYNCTIQIDGVDTAVQAFLGTNATTSTTLETIIFGNTTALTNAIANGTTITIPEVIVFEKDTYTITANLGGALNLEYVNSAWTVVPVDHTPASGMEIPANVTNLSKDSDFSSDLNYTISGTVERVGNMLKLSESTAGTYYQMGISGITADTTYIASYYVWTVGSSASYEMDFQSAGSPNHTVGDGYNPSYVEDVLANWQTDSTMYAGLSSCTIDGQASTAAITGNSGMWKKVVVEWTPDESGTVHLQLGGGNGHGSVTGTVYIDDLAVYAKPQEITLTAQYYAVNTTSNQIQYNVKSTGGDFAVDDFDLGKSRRGWYDCTIQIDGVDTDVQAFLGTNADASTTLETIRFGDNGTTTLATAIANGSTITIPKEMVFMKTGYSITADLGKEQTLVYSDGSWSTKKAAVTTDIALYHITENNTAFTYTADLLGTFANGTVFTGNLLVNDVAQSVSWTLSDACLVLTSIQDNGSITSIQAVAGTVLTDPEGNTITLNNSLRYEKQNVILALNTEVAFYKIIGESNLAYTIVNEEVRTAFSGKSLTGSLKVNGTAQDVKWTVSGNCFLISGIVTSDVTTLEVVADTVLTNNDGSGETITITNGVTYEKLYGNWVASKERDTIIINAGYHSVLTANNQIQYNVTSTDGAYSNDDYISGGSKRSWYDCMVNIGGTDQTIKVFLGDDDATDEKDMPTLRFGQADVLTTAIAEGTTIVFPTTIGIVGDSYIIELNLGEKAQNIVKLGQGWAMYTDTYDYNYGGTKTNNEVLYYNIDNSTSYMLTSSNDAIAVEEDATLTTGSTISKVGEYHVSRIEDQTKFEETIVLYRHGDADENDVLDSRDLVAMKWAENGTSDKQNARTAGTYAADVDRSFDVDDVDLRALRMQLVGTADITASKGNSILNGEMPIAGFSTPTEEAMVTDDVYSLIQGTGINTIVFCGNGYNDNGVGALADKQIQLAEKYGIKMYVTDSYSSSGSRATLLTDDNFASRTGLYSMYHSFAGIHLADEPTYGDTYVNTSYDRNIKYYKKAIELCNQTANVSGYMNYTPYYPDTFNDDDGSKYKEYLKGAFTASGAEMLSFDHYPVRVGEGSWWEQMFGTDFKKTTKAADFYKNLEMVRSEVSGTKKPFWYIAQAGASSTVEATIAATYCPTAAEQQWEINAALAMGAKGITYWQLFQSAAYSGNGVDCDRSGLIGYDGAQNDTYYNAAVSQNAFIKVVDEVLMNATNEGVIANDSSATSALTFEQSSYNEVKSVTGTNALVGCFDYYGKTALYVVNCSTTAGQYEYLYLGKECNAYITKMGATEVNRTSATTVESDSNGDFVKVWLEPGQAALVIIE